MYEPNGERTLVGVEAVIDRTWARLLAREEEAELPSWRRTWTACTRTGAHRSSDASSGDAGGAARASFAAGSMGPKVDAAMRFRRRHGQAGGDRKPGADRADRGRHRGDPGGALVSADGTEDDGGLRCPLGSGQAAQGHGPPAGLSLQRLTPSNHDELLFDDILWSSAQYEHDQFVEKMRERGVESSCSGPALGALAASDEGVAG